MRFALFLALCLGVSAVAASEVLTLTTENFDAAIKENELIVVEFYAPWCGHCKKLEPEYEKAAVSLKGKVALAKVDATQHPSLSQRYGVRGFPTLKIFRNGGAPSEYAGGRTHDTIVSYLEKQVGPSALPLTSVEQAKEFVKSDKVVVVGFFADTSAASESATVFLRTADRLRDSFVFGLVTDAAVAAALEVELADKVVMFKQFDDGRSLYSGENSVDALVKWIDIASYPLIDEVGNHNYARYLDRGLPIIWLFINLGQTDDAARQAEITKHTPALVELAKDPQYAGKFSFLYMDGVRFAGQMQQLGMYGWPLPAMGLQDNKRKFQYVPESQEAPELITAEDMRNFIGAFQRGELKAIVRSQGVAEPYEDHVRVVVGNNFEEVVTKSGKDVLIEFYAPWCGHCKKLAPIYSKVAEALSDVDSVIIAKMDATQNDVPVAGFEFSGFPTIMFVRADKPNAPMEYNGDRTEKGFLSYIQQHASKKFMLANSPLELTKEIESLPGLADTLKSVLKENTLLKEQVKKLNVELAALKAKAPAPAPAAAGTRKDEL